MHCGWERKMVQPLGKTVWWSFRRLNEALPCDPAIPLLRLYPKEVKAGTGTGICTPKFITIIHNSHQREATDMPIDGRRSR